MMKISDNISLEKITIDSHEVLYQLMCRIYPPTYIDYWKDNGEWYVNNLYNIDNIRKELAEENTGYFFILKEDKIIGILRIIYNLNSSYKQDNESIKLHRLYLDQTIQNKGIGYQIMSWLIDSSKEKGYKKLWLEAMEKQDQAIYFYQKLGFKKTDKVTVEFPLLFDEYRGMFKMVKRL